MYVYAEDEMDRERLNLKPRDCKIPIKHETQNGKNS